MAEQRRERWPDSDTLRPRRDKAMMATDTPESPVYRTPHDVQR